MFSFRLSEDFLTEYKDRPVPWGYQDAAGNSVGEITFLRTYSRIKPDGSKERWWEVCQRVIEGMFSIQKDWCATSRLPWSHRKAQTAAQDAYERLFSFKWTPPGRGLWMMGTSLVMEQRNSAALQNCAFVSTADMDRHNPAEPFAFLMEASMLGVGVGFDALGATKGIKIQDPSKFWEKPWVIPDSREGWVESTARVINSYLRPGQAKAIFDYSQIRLAGTPIKIFGGKAAGPEPLIRLHDKIRKVFEGRVGQELSTKDIADIGNLIGVCVVAGNVRRSAELFIGSVEDKEFLNLKNPEIFPERNSYDPADPGWGWMSNNSVAVEVGDDLSEICEGISRNGEPGVIWLDISRQYGRLVDPPNNKDWRVAGYNPCAEQSLESYEMCTLVETFINRHESVEDFKRTQKVAYLYAKTVTLLPTHWQRTNAIMQRNRRIGTSISGMANFADDRGLPELKKWLNQSYEVVQYYDGVYSEWLGVRESIKTTTVKPSGTVSILAGESPGVHWAPGGEFFMRAIRFAKDDEMVEPFRKAGYLIEQSVTDPETTVVVYFPVRSKARRSEKDVTLFEKANLAVTAQRYWSDNSVSVTLSFDQEAEGKHVPTILHMHEGALKTVSFLPMGNKTYPQQPYTSITAEEWEKAGEGLGVLDLEGVYGAGKQDAVGEAYCTTDVCEVRAG